MDIEQAKDDLLNQLAKETDLERKRVLEQKYKRLSMNSSLKTASGECSASHITWGPNGYQCLNCGAEGEHSWDIKHDPKKNPQLRASLNKVARVVHQKDGWHVLSEKGKNLGGPYGTKGEAVKRLRQVEYFKHNGSKVRPFSKKASEVMVDPYQALTQQITDMRSRMEQVQQRLESSPLPKQAGKDETDPSELSIEQVFEDVAMGLDLLESKLKDEPESEELHKSLEELENLLWETEQKAGIKPEISDEEKAEPEHKETIKEIVKEVLKEIEEKKEEKPEEKEEKKEEEIIEINAAAVPNPALGQPIVPTPAPVKNVQPTDADNLNISVVKPTSPPPPGMVWIFDTEGNKYVAIPDPANPQKTI
jgi:hypothetical protein